MGVGHGGGPYMTPAESRTDVVVVGGGLAGISAAIDLAEAGLSVTMLEARPWLGGATCSFARRGLIIDNGQHTFLRCCGAYQDLLAKLGVASLVAVQNRLEIAVLGSPMVEPTVPGSTVPASIGPEPSAPVALRRSGLPAPLHLVRALAEYRLLPKAERLKAAAVMAALRFTGSGPDDDDISFGEWLADRGQGETARRLLWDLLSAAALGLPADQADRLLAVTAIRTALLSGRGSADIGVPAVPLSKLHSGPAAALLSRLGARVLLGVRATAIQLSGRGGYDIWLDPAAPGNQAGVLGRGPSALHAAGLVLAVPAWEAAWLAPAELSREAERWGRLEAMPVLSLHVIYGSPVTRLPYAVVVDSPVRWVVDKTGPAGLHVGQYLAASVPAADSYVDLPASRLRAELLPELERLFPAATDAELQDFFITRERRALIRQVPGSQRLRASQPAGLPGLALAGAWTNTGWPDTMEGAVRSGHIAALKVLSELTCRRAYRERRCDRASTAGGEHGARDMTGTQADLSGAQLAGAAVQRATRILLARQDSRGRWSGRSAGDVSLDAEVVLVREFLGLRTAEVTSAAAQQIRSGQQPDGSWIGGAEPDGTGDLSASVLAYLALRLAGDLPDAYHLAVAAGWIRDAGGIEAVGLVARSWLAAFGLIGWADVGVPAPEFVYLPARFAPAGGQWAGWSRQVVVSLTIIATLRPRRRLPIDLNELRASGLAAAPPPARSRVALSAAQRMAVRTCGQWLVDWQQRPGLPAEAGRTGRARWWPSTRSDTRLRIRCFLMACAGLIL